MTNEDDLECGYCAKKAEDYRCSKCKLTGYEIYVARWENENGALHPSSWSD